MTPDLSSDHCAIPPGSPIHTATPSSRHEPPLQTITSIPAAAACSEVATVNLALILCLLWMGVVGPTDFTEGVEQMVFEHVADPVERWRPLVAEHFPESEVETALCIIRHESSGDPRADNPRSSAAGLFQILGSLWAPHFGIATDDLYDPALNVELARRIWDESGWRAWSPYQRGLCH